MGLRTYLIGAYLEAPVLEILKPAGKIATPRPLDQGSAVEATVVQKLNQGTLRQKGCNLLSGSFFGYFFGQAKK